ncbi:Outer mitochondrial transmembrane helix translocase [Linum perenne]
MGGSTETKFLQELVLYAASAALSCLVLFAGLRHLDPNKDAAKKALEQKKEIAKRLGRPLIQTNPYEVEFNSIGGLDTIKQSLYELVILPLRRPELFSHGKLLGTGKTMLAKAIAKESGAVFINVRISNLMSKWFGDAQKLAVAAVFSLAYKLQPAIIFIDEVDSFLGQRRSSDHEALTNMKTEFMALWDGFTTDHESVEDNIDFNHVASLCEGYTGSDLFDLCKSAAYFGIRDLLSEERKGKKRQVSILLIHSFFHHNLFGWFLALYPGRSFLGTMALSFSLAIGI